MSDTELMPDPTAPSGTGPSGDRPVSPGIDYRQLVQATRSCQMSWRTILRDIGGTGKAQEAEELASRVQGFFQQGERFRHGTLNVQTGYSGRRR